MAANQKAKIPAGFVIAGKYRVTGELGRGGMAAVYEAENVDIGKRVAIKVLAQELISSTTVVERFLREARAVAAIRSPHICDVYDSGRLDDGRPFLVLELLEGESLYEQMVRVGQIDVDSTVDVISQACRGLTKAHSVGIVHRDLKPENIFITKDEEGRLLAKVLDFGLAKFYAPLDDKSQTQARLTREGAVFGTPAYMSPEQVRGQGAVDSRADLWALGCITYECLTGRTVWSTEQGVAMTFAQIASANLPDPMHFRPDLAPSFKVWFQRALHRDIAQRFQTPKEFAEALAGAFDRAPASSRFSRATDTQNNPLSRGAPLASSPATLVLSPTPPPSSAVAAPPPSGPGSAGPGSASNPSAPSNPSSQRGARGVPSPTPSSAARASRAHFAKPGATPSSPDASSPGKALLVVAASAVIAGGGYFGYRNWAARADAEVPSTALSAQPAPTTSASAATVTSAAPSVSASASAGLPFRAQVSKAQELIAAGDLAGADKELRDAFAQGAHGLPRTLLEHLDQARAAEQENPLCKLTGLGRPRTYDLADDKVRVIGASRPSIAVGPKGPVVVWTENRNGAEQAYAVALDPALRARSAAFSVTPEGQMVGRPEVVAVGDRFVLTYWDARGPEAGVYARYLDADGRIASSAALLGKAVGGASWPSITPMPDKSFWLSWVAASDKNTEDLYLQKVSENLESVGEPARITAFRPSPLARTRARFTSQALEGDALRIAFRLERDPERFAHQLFLAPGDLTGGPGGAPKFVDDKNMTNASKDRAVGQLVQVNKDRTRVEQPALACGPEGCFLGWGDEGREGSFAAYFEKGKPAPLKYEKFAARGKHPGLAIDPTGKAQVFWYEGGKLMTSPLDRDGVKQPSRVARVSGDQPAPSVAAGPEPGHWYAAWLDYEAGHLEAYVARVACK